jgi:hypothetical protein
VGVVIQQGGQRQAVAALETAFRGRAFAQGGVGGAQFGHLGKEAAYPFRFRGPQGAQFLPVSLRVGGHNHFAPGEEQPVDRVCRG